MTALILFTALAVELVGTLVVIWLRNRSGTVRVRVLLTQVAIAGALAAVTVSVIERWWLTAVLNQVIVLMNCMSIHYILMTDARRSFTASFMGLVSDRAQRSCCRDEVSR